MSSAASLVKPHRWTRTEYERMVEAGVFSPEARFELIDGEIIDMSPQGSYHATSIQVMADYIRNLFGVGYHVRIQMPLALGDASEPGPDVAREHCLEVFQQPENGRYTSYRSLKTGSAFVCGNGKQVAVGNVLV